MAVNAIVRCPILLLTSHSALGLQGLSMVLDGQLTHCFCCWVIHLDERPPSSFTCPLSPETPRLLPILDHHKECCKDHLRTHPVRPRAEISACSENTREPAASLSLPSVFRVVILVGLSLLMKGAPHFFRFSLVLGRLLHL